jgi:prepilin-type processing-associated H-X9-DG protein
MGRGTDAAKRHHDDVPIEYICTVISAGKTYDVDFTSNRFGGGSNPQTYRVVIARSYHSGGVNTMLLDGSVRFVRRRFANDLGAYGTRAGGEAVGEL